MKRGLRAACGLAFLLLCAGVWLFFQPLTQTGGAIPYLEWETCAVADETGAEVPFDPYAGQPQLAQGERFRFALTLPERTGPSVLFLDTSGGAFTLTLDGAPLYESCSAPLGAGGGQSTLNITLPAGGGERLVLEVVPAGTMGLFPTMVQLTDDPTGRADAMAYANYYALPAGATALALVLLGGLFLLGAAEGRPDWRLFLLIFAAAELTVYPLATGFGTYFFSPPLLPLLSWPGWSLLTAAALAAYLALQRSRAFWRAWGLTALVSAGALLACWGLSALTGGYLAGSMAYLWMDLRAGVYTNLLYWLTLWLEGVCALLSVWALVRSTARREARLRAMEVQYALTVDNYRQFKERSRQTAALRHEWKNQLAALHLLQRAGDLAGLGEKLEAMEGELGRLSERSYTRQPALNAIFQNTAYRAERLGVDFQGQVLVPEDLEVDEGDLCALLLNLLDNALEGAARVPPPGKREVQCTVKLTQGFLAVWCRNTYAGPLDLDDRGRPRTTKADGEGHGFGLAQMRAVAAKYHSVLTIDHDKDTFTVQTALKL